MEAGIGMGIMYAVMILLVLIYLSEDH